MPTFFFADGKPMLPFEIENRRDEIKRQVEKLGAELVEINFRRSGRRSILVIIADKPNGITLDACAEINRHLSQYFDALSNEGGFLSTPYYLEVNSPGLDRPLKTEDDFKRVIGQRVRVAFKNDRGAGLVWVGEVLRVENGVLTLQPAGGQEEVSLPLGWITKASREIRIGK